MAHFSSGRSYLPSKYFPPCAWSCPFLFCFISEEVAPVLALKYLLYLLESKMRAFPPIQHQEKKPQLEH